MPLFQLVVVRMVVVVLLASLSTEHQLAMERPNKLPGRVVVGQRKSVQVEQLQRGVRNMVVVQWSVIED